MLAGDDALPGQVQQLADAETSCSSFFTFTVIRLGAGPAGTPGETVVALVIEVPPAHADVLNAFLDRAAAQVTA